MSLTIVPVSLEEANAFVEAFHRHHKPVIGHKFSLGVTDGKAMAGVAIVGRPVARGNDDGLTLEVNRCCTDGTRNACSIALRSRMARSESDGLSTSYYLHAAGGRRRKPARSWLDTDRATRRRQLEHAESPTNRHGRTSARAKEPVGSLLSRPLKSLRDEHE